MSDRTGAPFLRRLGTVVELQSARTCVAAASPFVSSVVNASNYTGANLAAPGEIVQIFGTAVGPDTLIQATFDSNGSLPTTLAGMQVLVDGAPTPLLFASAGITAAIVPFGVTSQDWSILRIDRSPSCRYEALRRSKKEHSG